jgi:hypothetical protein
VYGQIVEEFSKRAGKCDAEDSGVTHAETLACAGKAKYHDVENEG